MSRGFFDGFAGVCGRARTAGAASGQHSPVGFRPMVACARRLTGQGTAPEAPSEDTQRSAVPQRPLTRERGRMPGRTAAPARPGNVKVAFGQRGWCSSVSPYRLHATGWWAAVHPFAPQHPFAERMELCGYEPTGLNHVSTPRLGSWVDTSPRPALWFPSPSQPSSWRARIC